MESQPAEEHRSMHRQPSAKGCWRAGLSNFMTLNVLAPHMHQLELANNISRFHCRPLTNLFWL